MHSFPQAYDRTICEGLNLLSMVSFLPLQSDKQQEDQKTRNGDAVPLHEMQGTLEALRVWGSHQSVPCPSLTCQLNSETW